MKISIQVGTLGARIWAKKPFLVKLVHFGDPGFPLINNFSSIWSWNLNWYNMNTSVAKLYDWRDKFYPLFEFFPQNLPFLAVFVSFSLYNPYENAENFKN